MYCQKNYHVNAGITWANSKAKTFKQKHEARLEIAERWRFQTKNAFMAEYDYFQNKTVENKDR